MSGRAGEQQDAAVEAGASHGASLLILVLDRHLMYRATGRTLFHGQCTLTGAPRRVINKDRVTPRQKRAEDED
jgi:hypothetical protein